MSPFTADSRILVKVLSNDGPLWKSLSGPIVSMEFLERSTIKISTTKMEQKFLLKVTTLENDLDSKGKQRKTSFSVKALWDYMDLESVAINELEL
jgi:hypothetical protein